jgi:ferredoxin
MPQDYYNHSLIARNSMKEDVSHLPRPASAPLSFSSCSYKPMRGIITTLRKRDRDMIPYVDFGLCVGCGACVELYPLFFEMRDEKAWVINYEKFDYEEHKSVVAACPFGAITVE